MKRCAVFLIVAMAVITTSCKKSHLNNDLCDCSESTVTEVVDTITLWIPNIITPNGDGINDIWYIQNIEYFPDCKIKIMKTGVINRTVYESTGYEYDNWWDGVPDNNGMKEGKYKYEITIGDVKIKGFVCVFAGEKYQSDDLDCLKECTPIDPTDPLLFL